MQVVNIIDKLLKLSLYFTAGCFWGLIFVWWTFGGCQPGTIAIPMHEGFYCVQATKWVGK